MKIYTENFTILLNKHITNKEIDTYEFRVMCYLLMLSDNDGTCYPSYKTIADRIDILQTLIVITAIQISVKNGYQKYPILF